MDRVILHSDINACYASIELLFAPKLRGKPMAVGGEEELRHGIVLSKTEEAKAAGVKTGMTIWEAKNRCPELVVLPPRFDRYLYFTRQVQKIYADYTDRRESFGIDESWLDLSGCIASRGGAETAREIGRRVKNELGLTVSVGVSWNKMFAKLGSDYKKPDAVTVIDREIYRELVWPLPAGELLFVGRATTKRLAELGIRTIGELAAADPETLRLRLGKCGVALHAAANGRDTSEVRRAGDFSPPKSIGNGTTPPRDMTSLAEAMPVIMSLAESVGARLRRAGVLARTITLELRSADLSWRSHRMRPPCPTDCDRELLQTALLLLAEAHRWPDALRGIAIRAEELLPLNAPAQLDVFTDYVNRDRQRRLDAAMDSLRRRYGGGAVRRGAVFESPSMAVPVAQEEYAFVRKAEDFS
ncbi:MAG: DNA polymerase IV [Oscillospiraceae bacterium]